MSLRAQSNGRYFQSYTFHLRTLAGGKKPNSFTVGAFIQGSTMKVPVEENSTLFVDLPLWDLS
ncbi:MAG: hypothetical protein IPQ10_08840 [Saprospiraceae bacterium]|nr:hypothetical protein [Saprospiraceae bacterium]